jgi:hypothetical protein
MRPDHRRRRWPRLRHGLTLALDRQTGHHRRPHRIKPLSGDQEIGPLHPLLCSRHRKCELHPVIRQTVGPRPPRTRLPDQQRGRAATVKCRRLRPRESGPGNRHQHPGPHPPSHRAPTPFQQQKARSCDNERNIHPRFHPLQHHQPSL